jgi:3-oxoacyl-(acyl-carrier-protein) synthase
MQLEILEYKYILDWNITELTQSFVSFVQPNYPFVMTTSSGLLPGSKDRAFKDWSNGRRRGRPSDVRGWSEDGLVSSIAGMLGVKDLIFNVRAECSGSLYAFYLASLISFEKNTPVIVVAADNNNDAYDHWHFQSLGALDNATGRPFDTSSKGFKMGRGAAIFLVKHPNVKSNLPAKALFQNFYFYSNPQLFANPGNVDDIIKNLPAIDYSKFDFWNSHATGTLVGDTAEYYFFKNTIKKDIPIVSYKGYIGHTLTSSGALEIAISLDDKKNNVLRPNVIVENKIVNDDRIITTPTSFTFKKMLKVSLGFGGKVALADIDIF